MNDAEQSRSVWHLHGGRRSKCKKAKKTRPMEVPPKDKQEEDPQEGAIDDAPLPTLSKEDHIALAVQNKK